ncbi:hypothetical protein [Paracoccus jiaweipingae]|uniref:hypothetical protein n=1 Tax=unclassified Paracoccus (in: a-proteobacteria) TaxID=2688777 RepID=UPI0037910DA6
MLFEETRHMADEVAGLMAARFGGARRGEAVTLDQMMRRRGGALPRRLRREGRFLARADLMAHAPKTGRQIDLSHVARAHHALTAYLRALNAGQRAQTGALRVSASIAFGLLMMGLLILWVLIWRGFV